MTVIKRSGEEVAFDSSKILNAVLAVNNDVTGYDTVDEHMAKAITDSVIQKCEALGRAVNVEEIQDLVEKELMVAGKHEASKRYILYRFKRAQARQNKTLTEKLTASNVQNQNANVDEASFGGRLGEAASYVLKQYALDNIMSKMAARNHLNNEIYTHDLDHYALGDHNCAHGDMWVKIKWNGTIKTIMLKDLASEIGLTPGKISDVSKACIEILSRDGWTKLLNVTSRYMDDDELLYTIKTKTGIPLKLTAHHRLPIIRNNEEIVVEVKDIKKGDSLIDIENVNLSQEEISDSFLNLMDLNDECINFNVINTEKLSAYLRYKYGVVLAVLCREHNLDIHDAGGRLPLKIFKDIMTRYPLTFDVLTSLRIKAHGSKHSYPLFIPYSKELAKVYAYIYADGGVYVKEEESMWQLTFTNTNEALMDDFIDCYESCFGYRLNKSYAQDWHTSPCTRVTDGSRLVVKLFRNFAGARKYGFDDISVPDFVMNGPTDIKYAYLSAAIDTDGCLGKNLTYTTGCRRYAEQIMTLMKDLGYHPVINQSWEKGCIYRIGHHSGVRNSDGFNISLRRNDEMYRFQENASTLKHNDSYSFKGLKHCIGENRVVGITTSVEKCVVYDMETVSHWYIVNNIVSHNCLSIPFDKLLAEGFNTRQTDVRPAGSLNTAFQLVAVIFQLQSLQQFGGVSATHLDWTMVPYLRLSFFKHYCDGIKYILEAGDVSDDFTKEEIKNLSIEDPYYTNDRVRKYALDKTTQELNQAVEGMLHNLNTLQSRSGCQLPFTSINYGTCTSVEGRMIITALIKGTVKGVGKFHRTSIFPCGIFQCMKGVNRKPGDPNYDLFRLALKCTAMRIYPNYANVDWSGNAGYDPENPCTFFSTMGCRTANGWDINCENEKLGQLKDGRGNICPCTIILPTLAMEAKTVDAFMKLLDKKIGEAKDQLIERFNYICSQSPAAAKFMYENGTMYGYKPEEGIRSALKHGTLAMGQLGLAECLQILIGCDHTDPKGMELAKKIEALFKKRCAEFKQEYKLNFGVYLTPAENLAYTAMNKFREKYGVIKNVSDHDFFTNSIHVPVWHKMTPFEKIDLEAQLTGYSSAGCITYVELDSSAKNNVDAMEELVNYAMDKDIPYFAVNVPIDTCQSCGYQDDISGDACPKCGSHDIQRLRRVTGYITGNYTTAFNPGKQKEVEARVKHNGIEA